ncbi:MAG: GAF domain-containing protein, partial [Chloroflexota bacterium]
DRLLKLIARVVPYDSANVMLVDNGRVHVVRNFGYEQFDERVVRDVVGLSFEIAATPNLRQMAETRQPLVIPDTAADPGWVNVKASAYVRSWAGAPLVVRDQIIAFFSLDKIEPNFYQPGHGQRLAAFATQAALALENARLFEAERDQGRRLAAVGEVVRQAASLDLDELLHRAVDLLQRTFGYYCVDVLLVDPPAGEIVRRASAGRRLAEGYRLRIGEPGISSWVAANGQPLLVNDVEREPHYHFAPELAETRSELAVPILSAGQVVGVLDVQSDRTGAFAAADRDMLQTIAAHLSVAIANAQSFEEATFRFNDMRVLREVGVIISASLDLPATLMAILDQAVVRLATDAADVLLLQADDKTLEYAAGRGFRTEALQHTRLPLGEGYAGR